MLKATFPQLVSPSSQAFTFVRQCLQPQYLYISIFSVYPHRNQHGQTSYFSSCPHSRYGRSTGFLPTVSVSLTVVALQSLSDLCTKDATSSYPNVTSTLKNSFSDSLSMIFLMSAATFLMNSTNGIYLVPCCQYLIYVF